MLNFRGFEVSAGCICFKQHMIYDSKFPGKDHVYIYIYLYLQYMPVLPEDILGEGQLFSFFKATTFV